MQAADGVQADRPSFMAQVSFTFTPVCSTGRPICMSGGPGQQTRCVIGPRAPAKCAPIGDCGGGGVPGRLRMSGKRRDPGSRHRR